MQTAAFSLAEVQYATGDNISYQVQESVQKLDSPSKQNKKMFLGCFTYI